MLKNREFCKAFYINFESEASMNSNFLSTTFMPEQQIYRSKDPLMFIKAPKSNNICLARFTSIRVPQKSKWDSLYFDSIEDDNQILPAKVYSPNLLMRPHLPPPTYGSYKNQQSAPKDIVRTTDLKAVAKLIRRKTVFKQLHCVYRGSYIFIRPGKRTKKISRSGRSH